MVPHWTGHRGHLIRRMTTTGILARVHSLTDDQRGMIGHAQNTNAADDSARSCFHFFVCLSICLSVFMSVRLSVRLTVFLYILLSVVFVCPLSLDFAVFLYYV